MSTGTIILGSTEQTRDPARRASLAFTVPARLPAIVMLAILRIGRLRGQR